MTIVNYKDFLDMARINEEIPNVNAFSGKYRDGITEKQKLFLRRLGIGTTGIKCKGQAHKIIDYALERERNGLATPGQMRALTKLGLKNVHCYSFNNAKKTLQKYDEFAML